MVNWPSQLSARPIQTPSSSTLRLPEGNIYFASEYISVRHGWIVGALDSVLQACNQMLSGVDFKHLSCGAETLQLCTAQDTALMNNFMYYIDLELCYNYAFF